MIIKLILRRTKMVELMHVMREVETGEFPLPVAEDWDHVVEDANEMANVIDAHLDHESGIQGRYLRPAGLCPDQQVNLASDLGAI